MHDKMGRTRSWIGRALAVLSLTVALVRSAQADGIVPGHVLVRIKPTASIERIAQDYGATVEDRVPGTRVYSLALPAGKTEEQFARELRADLRLLWAEPDTYVLSPEAMGQQFHHAFDAGPEPGDYVNQNAYQQVNLGSAPSLTTGAGVIVAVIDTGATFSHPDLIGRYLPGYNVLQPDSPPFDVPDGTVNNAVGHGTMIAGIIARLAPDAKIMPVRVLNGDGLGTMLDVAKGVHYAVQNGAKVLNMSFGSTTRSKALEAAMDEAQRKGVVMVASAGNHGANRRQYPTSQKGCLVVASVEADHKKSSYSNYGSFVRIVAPGSGIRSTYWTGGYANWSGTSFAVPFVSAQAALIRSINPSLKGRLVQELIRETARSVDTANPAYEGRLGKGIIDIEAAVLAARP